MNNATTHTLADSLVKLAEHFKSQPETPLGTDTPYVRLGWFWSDKDGFMALTKVMPKPLKKHFSDDDLEVSSTVGIVKASFDINRKAVCRLVEPARPAVYDCEPLLSPEEEEQIP